MARCSQIEKKELYKANNRERTYTCRQELTQLKAR